MKRKEQAIEACFPSGKRVSHPRNEAGKVYLPLSHHQWLEVAQEELTMRERSLVRFFLDVEEALVHHPWYDYLLEDKPAPSACKRVQFVYVRLWETEVRKADVTGWLEMMKALLPQQLAVFPLSEEEYVFVLDQEVFQEVGELLAETLPALEFDFGLGLTFLEGQVWSHFTPEQLPLLFQAELELFRLWQERAARSRLHRFSQVFLWSQGKAGQPLEILRAHLGRLIQRQEHLVDIIQALWEEGAVVTKAAQRLYLHRNTLHYRLDKWQEISGLQLRQLTDLTLCYLVVMEEIL